MNRKLIAAALLAMATAGCVTTYGYRSDDGAGGDYYYAEPSVDVIWWGEPWGTLGWDNRWGWHAGFGLRSGYGSFGYGSPWYRGGYGYGGYGFPWYDPWGGYYVRPPHHPPPNTPPPGPPEGADSPGLKPEVEPLSLTVVGESEEPVGSRVCEVHTQPELLLYFLAALLRVSVP